MELITSNGIDFAQYLENISYLEAEVIRPASSFQSDIDDYFEHGVKTHGLLLPWDRTHDTIQLAPGELTIWGGQSGNGKSQICGQVILWAMRQERALIASLEMKPWQTLTRLASQAAGCEASRAFVNHFMGWTDGRLWIYDQLDSVDSTRILGMVHYAAVELGINHIVIDSLTKCGLSRDDYTAQARFVDRLQWAAKRYSVHVHLVCHMRKGQEGHKPGKHDIRGAAEITDLADNVFVVNRNKAKEAAVEKQAKGRVLDKHEIELLDMPDTFLEVAKNRKTGEEKTFGLWFDKSSNQFVQNDRRQSMYFDIGFSKGAR